MRSATLNKTRFALPLAAGLLLAATRYATAVPIQAAFVDDNRGDAFPNLTLHSELGDAAAFPALSAFAYHDHRLHYTVGVPDDGITNDWTVHITNTSGLSWKNLFFVADLGATIGNADGKVQDMVGAPGVFCDAFRIDGTATAGVNANLLWESMAQDEILEPGEQWEFAVSNFGTGLNSIPPTIYTPGEFAGSSHAVGVGTGNGSIIAEQAVLIPEPSTLSIALLGAGALLMRRPQRARN